MKPNTLRCLGMTAAAAVAVWCWLLLRMEPETPPRAAGKGLTLSTSVAGNQAAPKLAEPLPKFGTSQFHRMVRERGEKWLETRGRDASGLLAMLDVTGDEAFLAEAAQKFPDDPRVCMAQIEYAGGSSARPWIERLIAAEPGNPEGHFQKAWLLTSGGPTQTSKEDYAEAMAALRQAAALDGGREDHMINRIQAVCDAAAALGVGRGDAARLSLAGPLTWKTATRVLIGAGSAISWELAEAKAGVDTERFMRISELGIVIAGEFASGGCVTLEEARQSTNLEAGILRDVPSDTMIGSGATSRLAAAIEFEAQQRQDQIVKTRTQYSSMQAVLKTDDDDLMVLYLNLFMQQGELAAQSWLHSQVEKAQ